LPFVVIILRRVGQAVGLLAAVAILNFTLIHLAPGDIVSTIVGEMGGAGEETIAQLRRAYGLDRSFPEQLWIYLSRVATGDLGTSVYYNLPVLKLILERVPATVLLVLTALAVALVAATANASRLNGIVTLSPLPPSAAKRSTVARNPSSGASRRS